MGTIYPCSDHYPPHLGISNKDFYFDNLWESFRNPIFCQIFGHQRAQNEARNTKMNRGQETHPLRVNAKYEMNGTNSFLKKIPETPFSAEYLATRGPKMRLGTRKSLGVKRLTPLEEMSGMKWIEPTVFSKNSENPIFDHIFGHQRAENEARNTKMYRGQVTHPIRVNARYEMIWANGFFKKFRKPCLQTDGRTDRHRGESFGGVGV